MPLVAPFRSMGQPTRAELNAVANYIITLRDLPTGHPDPIPPGCASKVLNWLRAHAGSALVRAENLQKDINLLERSYEL